MELPQTQTPNDVPAMIRVQCPQCRAVLSVGEDSRGRKVRCGACQSIIRIPDKKRRSV
jgi:predicted Zn finger-like uncharacterized protein